MAFHSLKCEVIHITIQKALVKYTYSLHGHTLSSVHQIKYLGVNISQDIEWNAHINSDTSKANQTLGFLKRNLRISSSTLKDRAYKPLVRPKLEYCSTVWDPKSVNSIKEGDKTTHRLADQLEMVQRRAARWVTGRYHSSQVSQTRCTVWTGELLNRGTTVHALQDPEPPCSCGGRLLCKRGTGQYREIRADKDYTSFSFFPPYGYPVESTP